MGTMVSAREKVQTILPTLRSFELVLVKIIKKYSQIRYYEKFRFHKDKPNLKPVKEMNDLVKEILKTKKILLEFKKSFDENELDNKLREIFLEIFVQITKKDELVKDGYIILGNGSSLWRKSVEHVIEEWSTMDYPEKHGYSLQCYNFIKGYTPLADLISQLDDAIYS
ncbi:MAG: hypothetical protein QG594_175 [Bacteroidota bacterium]|nr:hypothetical protein [Bacteroidota bacterium]